jgi:hypothetical protein
MDIRLQRNNGRFGPIPAARPFLQHDPSYNEIRKLPPRCAKIAHNELALLAQPLRKERLGQSCYDHVCDRRIRRRFDRCAIRAGVRHSYRYNTVGTSGNTAVVTANARSLSNRMYSIT